MNAKRFVALSVVVCSCLVAAAGTGVCQPMAKQAVIEIGAAFSQATVTKAQMGFLGIDIQTGRMLTNGLSVGVATGCDIVSLQKVGGIYERFSVVPILAKAKYYLNVAPLMQVHASVGAGAYQTLPHLNIEPIGGMWNADLRPGGAIGVGFDYWFLGSKGLTAEFEYNFFHTGVEESSIFSYFGVRLSFGMVKT